MATIMAVERLEVESTIAVNFAKDCLKNQSNEKE